MGLKWYLEMVGYVLIYCSVRIGSNSLTSEIVISLVVKIGQMSKWYLWNKEGLGGNESELQAQHGNAGTESVASLSCDGQQVCR